MTGASHSHANPDLESNNLSKFPFTHSYQFMRPVTSALDKQISVDRYF